MTLKEALDVFENRDFRGLDPEVLEALSVVLLAAQAKVRAPEQSDVGSRVVETTVD